MPRSMPLLSSIRRAVALAGAVGLVAALGACSSKSALGQATVNAAVGSAPTITVKGKPPETTQVKIVTRGTGTVAKAGDLAVVQDAGRTWASKAPFQDTFASSAVPDTLPIGTGQLPMAGLDGALVGVPTGSRVLVVIPPKEGFGQVTGTLPTGVTKSDTAVFVFDLLGAYAPDAGPNGKVLSPTDASLPAVSETDLHAKPAITIPKSSPPSKLSVTTLVQGAGPAVAKGQEVVVQYDGQVWASGKEFDSSWKRGVPSVFTVGAGNLIKAWDDGLIGVKVGSRVLIVAPPDAGYGAGGQPDAGISGTDTLVFVVDVLGAYSA